MLKESFDVTLNENDNPLSEELIDAVNNFDALLPTVTDKINDEIISSKKENKN